MRATIGLSRFRKFRDVAAGSTLSHHFVSYANSNPRDNINESEAHRRRVRSYQPRAAQYSVGDAACPGLCVRITPKGVKTFAFAYRNKGTRKVAWLTLGRYPDLPLARARELANDARKAAAPAARQSRQDRRAEAKKKLRPTPRLVELYYDAQLRDAPHWRQGTRRTLQRVGRVYGWNERPVASITDDDAAAMLHDIADRRGKKAMANQTKHILHAMFKWAKQPGRKFVTVNPFADLPAPGGAKRRGTAS